MEDNKSGKYAELAKQIPWKLCKKARRIVIKIGTRAISKEDGSFDEDMLKNLAVDLSQLYASGKEIIIVSSGAVNAGVRELKLPERPRDIIALQTMAAVGNPILINEFRKFITFAPIAQILITQEDLSNRTTFVNFRNTMEDIITRKIIPVINENDVVSVNELMIRKDMMLNFTDNDILAGLITATLNADLLIILSDIEGLYTKHPNSKFAEFVPYVPEITEDIFKMAKSGSEVGRGGMVSKIIAAQIATYAGAGVIIAHAKKVRLKHIFKGNATITFFAPKARSSERKIKDKDLWLMFAANVKGKIYIDEGAAHAIRSGASLLFNGIVRIDGDFDRDDIVEIHVLSDGNSEKDSSVNSYIIAKARVNYDSSALRRFAQLSQDERKRYFKKQNIREIISHEHMVFID